MSLVLPDGYALDTIGPLRGNMNCASIVHHVLRTYDPFTGWCEDNEVMIVDHGFWDVADTLHNRGYEPKTLAFSRKGKNRHTTEEAHESRLYMYIKISNPIILGSKSGVSCQR